MNTPKWVEDLDKIAAGMPFGELSVRVVRHRSKTSKVIYSKESKIAPSDNVQAFSDLEKFINTLILAQMDGKVQFALDLEKGTIKLITIKNKEINKYG